MNQATPNLLTLVFFNFSCLFLSTLNFMFCFKEIYN